MSNLSLATPPTKDCSGQRGTLSRWFHRSSVALRKFGLQFRNTTCHQIRHQPTLITVEILFQLLVKVVTISILHDTRPYTRHQLLSEKDTGIPHFGGNYRLSSMKLAEIRIRKCRRFSKLSSLNLGYFLRRAPAIPLAVSHPLQFLKRSWSLV